MDVPKDYDDEAERLSTHSLLRSNEDVPGTMTAADKTVLKKTNDKVSFAPCVSFVQRKSLKQPVRRTPKTQGTKTKSMPQRVTSLLVHHMNMLGVRDNKSPRYRRYLECTGRGHTKTGSDVT